MYVLSKNKKNIKKILLKIFNFYNLKKTCILHGHVFVMACHHCCIRKYPHKILCFVLPTCILSFLSSFVEEYDPTIGEFSYRFIVIVTDSQNVRGARCQTSG